jgi:hypothetical protein
MSYGSNCSSFKTYPHAMGWGIAPSYLQYRAVTFRLWGGKNRSSRKMYSDTLVSTWMYGESQNFLILANQKVFYIFVGSTPTTIDWIILHIQRLPQRSSDSAVTGPVEMGPIPTRATTQYIVHLCRRRHSCQRGTNTIALLCLLCQFSTRCPSHVVSWG